MGVYAIPECRYEGLVKKLDRIARKCERFGNPFTVSRIGEEYRTEDGITRKFVTLEVSGVAKVADWEFVGTVEVHDGGNVIRCAPDMEMPERFRHTSNVCEHCRTERPRNNLYVVRNVRTNEYRQVGGSCLALYTHGLNMEYCAAWMDGLMEVEDAADGDWRDGEGLGPVYYDVERVIALACAAIDRGGYGSSQSAYPTRAVVSELMRHGMSLDTRIDRANAWLPNGVRLTKDDISSVDASRVQAIIDYYVSLEDDGDFAHNVKVLLSEGYTRPENIGYLCYLPAGYARHLEQVAVRESRSSERHMHYGEVGRRYKGMAVKSVRESGSYTTAYGVTTVYTIVLDDDTALTWKSSKSIDVDTCGRSVDFTVKEHGEYRGERQTLVTRCSFK